MLPKINFDTDPACGVQIRKFVGSEDVSHRGALPWGSVVNIELTVSRRLGASGAVLRLCRDGEEDCDLPLSFCRSDNVSDVYCCTLDTAVLCKDDPSGLFYYEILLLRGNRTLFTDSVNNLDFELAEREGARFRLLVYEKEFTTPESFGGGVMYQIFPDRFFRGESAEAKAIRVKEGAVLNEDWETGIPQFAPYPGAPLKNNMFFGGNLYGVAEKLDYLASLGVTTVYLCPIFMAYSNHKYDTADYERVDPMFGGDEALDHLIRAAREKGIGIVLDGVFNHTGDDSRYFDRYGSFGGKGAYNDPQSPYRDWYLFKDYPDSYECWWGIDIHPKLNHGNEDCRRYFTGKGGIVEKYIQKGIAGWRLDVADELSDEFLDELRATAKAASGGEAVIIGEVWENAADKIAYGKRRRYFAGRQLDSVMNYPLKNAIVSFCLWGDGETLYNTLTELYSSYPPAVCHKLMNIIGTHDTERILTVLGRSDEGDELTQAEKSVKKLSASEREQAIGLLRVASVLQFTCFGIPSVYYGDEVGLEGYGDPFCRMPMSWGEIEKGHRRVILDHYRALGRIRREEKALDGGDFYVLSHGESGIAYVREREDSRLLIAVNRGEPMTVSLPAGERYRDLLSGLCFEESVTVSSLGALILKQERGETKGAEE